MLAKHGKIRAAASTARVCQGSRRRHSLTISLLATPAVSNKAHSATENCTFTSCPVSLLSNRLRHFTYSNSVKSSQLTRHYQRSSAMASDEDYNSFLEKANQDAGGSAKTQSKSATASNTANQKDVHPAIAKVDVYYTSETDEKFVPVTFVWDQDPDPLSVSTFETVLSTDADVEALSPKEFDPKGKYEQVISAVGQAGNGEVTIFKVDFGGTRLEYYVITIDKNGGLLVGLKASAVES